ncbi:hypothetical protein KY284_000664 [Solanum tuberosum]|nr:hypothetical protein KY284_000664 [Solanum tuberosum]
MAGIYRCWKKVEYQTWTLMFKVRLKIVPLMKKEIIFHYNLSHVHPPTFPRPAPTPPVPDRRHATIPNGRSLSRRSQQQVAAAAESKGRRSSQSQKLAGDAARRRTSQFIRLTNIEASTKILRPTLDVSIEEATEEAQHLKKLIEDYIASFIKVGDKIDLCPSSVDTKL